MALAGFPPNTVKLAGEGLIVADINTSEIATPGHLAEMFSDSGTLKWRKNTSATNQPTLAVYLEQDELNKGVDDNYAANSLAKVWFMYPGCTFWGLIASGQDIVNGDYLQSAGDGTLKEATAVTATANVARFQAIDSPGAVTALTRVKVQVIC